MYAIALPPWGPPKKSEKVQRQRVGVITRVCNVNKSGGNGLAVAGPTPGIGPGLCMGAWARNLGISGWYM